MPLFNPSSVTVYPSVSNVNLVVPTTVIATLNSVILLAGNFQRKGATIWNNSPGVLYVELGAIATTSAFTVLIVSAGYYEVPFAYIGEISGIWDVVNGNALVREFVEYANN
jgi:hypothetical protein